MKNIYRYVSTTVTIFPQRIGCDFKAYCHNDKCFKNFKQPKKKGMGHNEQKIDDQTKDMLQFFEWNFQQQIIFNVTMIGFWSKINDKLNKGRTPKKNLSQEIEEKSG